MGAVHFSTTLHPHRSLPPEGFKWLIRVAVAANLAIGLPMYFLGAWPVMGFMGLDVWLLWYMFQRSYLDARRRETLTLTDRELVVERISPEGEREEHRLDAYWLKLERGERDLIIVSSRGNRLVIGRFLSTPERRAAARELEAAIGLRHSPTYRHPWDDSTGEGS
jgi:uncharacterized membrane protein